MRRRRRRRRLITVLVIGVWRETSRRTSIPPRRSGTVPSVSAMAATRSPRASTARASRPTTTRCPTRRRPWARPPRITGSARWPRDPRLRPTKSGTPTTSSPESCPLRRRRPSPRTRRPPSSVRGCFRRRAGGSARAGAPASRRRRRKSACDSSHPTARGSGAPRTW